MNELLKRPRTIPFDELTVREQQEGQLPESIVPIESRVKTPEQQAAYEALCFDTVLLTRQLREAYPQPWTYEQEKLDDIVRVLEDRLVALALRARQFADSHRHFNVGVVTAGLRKVQPGENPWVIIFDANTRPSDTVRKHCGELYSMDRLDPELSESGTPEEKMDKVLAFIIAAESKEDDDSKKKQITLTPCKLCRDRMVKMARQTNGTEPLVSEDTTAVITVHSSYPYLRKHMKVRDLHRFHGEKLPAGVESIEE